MARWIRRFMVEGALRAVGQTIALAVIGALFLVWGFSPRYWIAANFWFNPPDYLVHPTTRLLILLVGLMLIVLVLKWPWGKTKTDKAETTQATEDSNEPIFWDNHLGHTYQSGDGGLRTKAIQISGTVGEKDTRLNSALIISHKSGKEAPMEVGLPDGTWVPPNEINSLPPDAIVTLRTEFNAPDGLPANDFIEKWGTFALRFDCDGVEYRKVFNEETVRKLFKGFRPNPLFPQVTRKR